MKTSTKYFFFFFSMFLLLFVILIYFWDSSSHEHQIDEGEGISGPYLSGDIIVEVDYMEGFEPTDSQLLSITEIFAEYGLNVTFIKDDSLLDVSEISDDDVTTYYNDNFDGLGNTWILFADEYTDSNILGAIYTSTRIVIYNGRVEDVFGDYRNTALKYVVCHEIGHAYGCVHCDEIDCIMYYALSIAKCIVYPDPEFCDECQVEL